VDLLLGQPSPAGGGRPQPLDSNRRVVLDELFGGQPLGQRIQDDRDQDSGALDRRLTVTDLGPTFISRTAPKRTLTYVIMRTTFSFVSHVVLTSHNPNPMPLIQGSVIVVR
jgi:hypothetical protein